MYPAPSHRRCLPDASGTRHVMSPTTARMLDQARDRLIRSSKGQNCEQDAQMGEQADVTSPAPASPRAKGGALVERV